MRARQGGAPTPINGAFACPAFLLSKSNGNRDTLARPQSGVIASQGPSLVSFIARGADAARPPLITSYKLDFYSEIIVQHRETRVCGVSNLGLFHVWGV